MDLFKFLDLETSSLCNRACPTCIRNSHPDREAVRSWFEPNYLPMDVIRKALDECVRINFRGGVCLSHYNEPLLDERIVEIAKLVKSYNRFYPVTLNSNGDWLSWFSETSAKQLDGVLDQIIISLYMPEPFKSSRAIWMKDLFKYTVANINTMSEHVPTHYSPKFDVKKLSEQYINTRCCDPQIRVIINHRRQFLFCCDDVVGNFGFGTFPEMSIEEYWFGEKHHTMIQDLNVGKRINYAYCSTCPRS